ncbi:DUF3813 domain-containing protein [Bacillus sp. FJAT-45350]|uniref:DUF3813 domain-containing protein n=1 Tax=Bacillus sp. FJAT-45350 TaxID=2011014 RepID=UPI000BB82621|nr:DUF3813 domain-containing protein [Bacillus sp. FJAT-45350]
MGNKLFQEARNAIEIVEQMASNAQSSEEIELARAEMEKAKNNLSSAFANSTTAEKEQLADMQNQLNSLETKLY